MHKRFATILSVFSFFFAHTSEQHSPGIEPPSSSSSAQMPIDQEQTIQFAQLLQDLQALADQYDVTIEAQDFVNTVYWKAFAKKYDITQSPAEFCAQLMQSQDVDEECLRLCQEHNVAPAELYKELMHMLQKRRESATRGIPIACVAGALAGIGVAKHVGDCAMERLNPAQRQAMHQAIGQVVIGKTVKLASKVVGPASEGIRFLGKKYIKDKAYSVGLPGGSETTITTPDALRSIDFSSYQLSEEHPLTIYFSDETEEIVSSQEGLHVALATINDAHYPRHMSIDEQQQIHIITNEQMVAFFTQRAGSITEEDPWIIALSNGEQVEVISPEELQKKIMQSMTDPHSATIASIVLRDKKKIRIATRHQLIELVTLTSRDISKHWLYSKMQPTAAGEPDAAEPSRLDRALNALSDCVRLESFDRLRSPQAHITLNPQEPFTRADGGLLLAHNLSRPIIDNISHSALENIEMLKDKVWFSCKDGRVVLLTKHQVANATKNSIQEILSYTLLSQLSANRRKDATDDSKLARLKALDVAKIGTFNLANELVYSAIAQASNKYFPEYAAPFLPDDGMPKDDMHHAVKSGLQQVTPFVLLAGIKMATWAGVKAAEVVVRQFAINGMIPIPL